MSLQQQGRVLTRKRVHIYGSAGHNLGDDAIALAARSQLQRLAPGAEVRIASVAMSGFGERYHVPTIELNRRSPWGQLRLTNSIRRADVVVIGGGTMIQDKLGLSRTRGMLSYVRQVATTAKAFGKPLLTLAIGVDELNEPLGPSYAAAILTRLDHLVVRDARSLALASDYAGAELQRTTIAADPAYLFRPELDTGTGLSQLPQQRYAVLSLVNEGLDFGVALEALATSSRALLKRRIVDRIVLLAMDRRASEERQIYARFLTQHRDLASSGVVIVPDDASVAHQVVASATLVLAMRLHAMIFAVGNVPLFGISRTTKTSTFLESAGVAHVRLEELTPESRLSDTLIDVLADTRALARQAAFRASQKRLAAQGLELLVEHIGPAVSPTP